MTSIQQPLIPRFGILLILVWMINIFGIQTLFSQQLFDARAAGMAFSNGAATRGLGHVGLNPATLALKTDYNFEFNLFSVNATANNNSFKKSEYDDYFTTGRFLTSEDIDNILNAIPHDGLRADGFARLNTISFYIPNFSLSLVGTGVGVVNVPKDFIELPLTGNREPGRVYNLDDAEGGDWLGLGVYASGAYPVWTDESSPVQFAAVGMTLKYISGFHYDDIVKSGGKFEDFSLAANSPFVNISGQMEILSANGGRGTGVDVGGVAIYRDKLTVGFTLLNLLSSVSWSDEPERILLSIRGDSLNLPNRVKDSLIVHTDTTISIGSFSTHLPPVMDFSFAYRWNPGVVVTAEYEQGLSDRMGGTKRARFAFGVEYTRIPVIPLRAGFTFGAKTGSSFAFGFGINLKYWYIDFAYLNHGRILPGDYKGIGLGVTSRLRF